jgi:O-antigen ligase
VALCFTSALLFLKNLKRPSTLIVFMAIIFLFVFFAQELYEQRATFKTTLSGKTQIEGSAQARINIALLGLQLFVRNPVWGVGPNRTIDAVKKDLESSDRHGIHNCYLLVLAEYGILGFVVYVSLFVCSFKSWARLRQHHDPFFKELADYLGFGLLGYMVGILFIPGIMEVNLVLSICLPVALEKISETEQLITTKQNNHAL